MFLVMSQDGTVYKGVILCPKTLVEHPVQFEVPESPEKKAKLEGKQAMGVSQTPARLFAFDR